MRDRSVDCRQEDLGPQDVLTTVAQIQLPDSKTSGSDARPGVRPPRRPAGGAPTDGGSRRPRGERCGGAERRQGPGSSHSGEPLLLVEWERGASAE